MIFQNGGWDGGWGEVGNRNKLLFVFIAKPVGPVRSRSRYFLIRAGVKVRLRLPAPAPPYIKQKKFE